MQKSVQKISLISEKFFSQNYSCKIYLANINNQSKPYILIENEGIDLTDIYNKLKDISSPYLPTILDVSYENDTTIILEEYIEGVTLAEFLNDNELSEDKAITLLIQLCNALKALHENNPPLIHRDVKPENIILGPNGNIKLIDFDAARIYKADAQNDIKDTRLLGTSGYASPEQYGFAQTDVRSDIYSVGMLIQYLISCSNFNSKTQKKLQHIALKASMIDPEKRYKDIRLLLNELNKISNHLSDTKRIKVHQSKLFIPFIALIFICIILVGVIIYRENTKNISKTSTARINPNIGVEVLTYKEEGATAFINRLNNYLETGDNIDYDAETINTLCDFVDFVRAMGITYETEELPFIGMPYWYVMSSAQTQIERKETNPSELTNLAVKLLYDDYEDFGVINICGDGFYFIPYAFQNEKYYILDCYGILCDDPGINPYPIFETNNIDDLAELLSAWGYTGNGTETIIMYSVLDNPSVPPLYLSYMHTGLQNAESPIEMGIEEAYFKSINVLYRKDDCKVNVIGIPANDIPDSLPKYVN